MEEEGDNRKQKDPGDESPLVRNETDRIDFQCDETETNGEGNNRMEEKRRNGLPCQCLSTEGHSLVGRDFAYARKPLSPTGMSRAVRPELVTTLKDWTARWPKATNLKFDPETREATVYSTSGAKVRSFPWEREGDILTVLAAPERFSAEMVAAARRRYGKYHDRLEAARTAAEGPMREAERALLEAWQAYRAAAPGTRAPLMRDVLAAEETVRELEETLASVVYRGREPSSVPIEGVYSKITLEKSGATRLVRMGDATGVYVPPFPVARRGMEAVEALGASSE